MHVLLGWQVPLQLRNRVRNYLDCMWGRGAAVHMKDYVREMPPVLGKEVMQSLCQHHLEQVKCLPDRRVPS